jgi:hypothetical protein
MPEVTKIDDLLSTLKEYCTIMIVTKTPFRKEMEDYITGRFG